MTACVGLLVCGLAMGCYVGGAVMPPEGYRCAKVSLVRETRPSLRVYMKALYEQRELLAAGLVERKSRPLTLHYFLHYVYLQLYTGKRIVLKVVALHSLSHPSPPLPHSPSDHTLRKTWVGLLRCDKGRCRFHHRHVTPPYLPCFVGGPAASVDRSKRALWVVNGGAGGRGVERNIRKILLLKGGFSHISIAALELTVGVARGLLLCKL
ncbi:hypothetical protein TcWFU_006184 [Taenia crassiceps]|uniref:Secreted protein n=1 Tax=Taenia crassiceps TaxID=6207 RepID=A0ABR4QI13_9CEST